VSTTIRNADEKINIEHLIHEKAALAPLSTYGTGGEADFLAVPGDLKQLRTAMQWAKDRNQPITILGGGSNVLIADAGVEGLVISTTGLTDHHVRGCLFCAQSGLPLDTAINVAIEHSLSGLEPLGGLPGTVGGAVRGNAAAGGLWISELIEWVDYLDEEGELYRYQGMDGGFTYKHSPFSENNSIIYEVAFRLIPNKNTSDARLKKEQSRTERLDTGQFDFPSAGCMFKNPRGISAGKLIDDAGLKGHSFGGARVSEHHANFIVNYNHSATSNDIYELSCIVEREILNRFDKKLEREVILIGRWNTED
jgi:UDP-N-acetylmuramate dehydrogenase